MGDAQVIVALNPGPAASIARVVDCRQPADPSVVVPEPVARP